MGPGRRFDPSELLSGTDADPSEGELADAFAAARILEAHAGTDRITPSDGFEDRVMAAIATEAAPRVVVRPGGAVRGGRPAALLVALRDAWSIATRGGHPLAVRAQALAIVLVAGACAADRIAPTDGFEDRVMAAIATEPTPRLVVRPGAMVRGGRPGAMLLALRDAWGIATSGGWPMAIRAQALAVVLVAGVVLTSLLGVAAVGVGGLLSSQPNPPPAIAPSLPPSQSPSAPSPSTSTTPALTPSPSPTETGPGAEPTSPTASPEATETPEPTETDEAGETLKPAETLNQARPSSQARRSSPPRRRGHRQVARGLNRIRVGASAGTAPVSGGSGSRSGVRCRARRGTRPRPRRRGRT